MLTIHRSERTDPLVDTLAGLLAEPAGDPLAPELVAIPSRGVERWLSQSLAARLGARDARGDGVCADIDFPFPGAVVAGALTAAGGPDPHSDPWAPERLVWPLLDVMAERAGEDWLAGPATHLGLRGSGARAARGRRWPGARHIADLFDRYALHRPAMLREWAGGSDTAPGSGGPGDPAGWQPRLWRAVRERIGQPSPAERTPDACAALRRPATAAAVDLPARLAVFGLTRLPGAYLDVIEALGAHRDVHLFLLHPSPALWREVAATGARPGPRAADRSARTARHPLLSSWARDAREMQVALAGRGARERHHPAPAPGDGLLGLLQSAVRRDTPPPGAPAAAGDEERPRLARDDVSLTLHACHGRERQVEVAREAILHALQDDPTLQPRDIVVMCPDVETVAPMVRAAFGATDDPGVPAGPGEPPALHVRLADRSVRRTNPVLALAARLLALAEDRVAVADVMDLLAIEPVRRLFALDDDDLARAGSWFTDAGVRWGIDEQHRAAFGVPDVGENTWRAGLDRLLLGIAMREEGARLVGGVLPLDDVGDGDIDLAGRLAEAVERIGDALEDLRADRPLPDWLAALARAVDALALCDGPDAWWRTALDEIGAELLDQAGPGAPARVLDLPELRALLGDRLRGRPTRASFRTGHLTVCTLVPQRSVPHRMICLVGLDDGLFPRRGAPEGDDLLRAEPHTGDRDARAEDRQLLLDAVMAAEERLVVTYTGRDLRTNTAIPPAVPVGELLDVIDATALAHDGRPASTAVLTEHPLHPEDPRSFAADAGRPHRPWGFDRNRLAAARAMAGARRPPRPFLDEPLEPASLPAVDLGMLERFLRGPVAFFLRERLGVTLPGDIAAPPAEIPAEADGLLRWQVGSRLVAAGLRGDDMDAACAAELARGVLPPGRLGEAIVADCRATARAHAEVARRHGVRWPGRSVPVDVRLPDGRPLTGVVPAVSDPVLWEVSVGSVNPRARAVAWVRLLALSAAEPEVPWTSVLVGRKPGKATATTANIVRIDPLGEDPGTRRTTASDLLARAVDLMERGLREPLPLFPRTSALLAEDRADGRGSDEVRAEWERTGGWGERPGERTDEAHRRAFGHEAPWAGVAAAPPRADEIGGDWPAADGTRVGVLALRAWGDLLHHETRRDA